MKNRHAVPAAVALVILVGISACSGLDQSRAASESDSSGSSGSAVNQLASMALSPTSGPTRVLGPQLDGLVVAEVGPHGLSPEPATSITPVTTVGGGGGAATGIYRGVMGRLAPDEQVTAPVADPPAAEPGHLPLTGELGVVPDRAAVVVKIDNSPPARPQTGLDQADLVIEEEVEGGLTRFAAVFHSRTTVVGPVRSGRTTDIGVLGSLGSPVLVYSGANTVTDTLIRDQGYVQNHSFDTASGYWRGEGRAPSNLFTDLAPHWAGAEGGPPPAQFAYRAPDDPVGGVPVSSLEVRFRANRVEWVWNGRAWLRHQGGDPHRAASGDQLMAANVVVMEAGEVATGMVDANGASVPEFVTVGSGPATVFTAGHRIEGSWTRPSLASVPTLTTPDGHVIELTPGRTWIELIEAGTPALTSTP